MLISTDELIDPLQVAGALNVKPQTLTAWRTLGKGPVFVKVGKRVFYRRADVESWLGAQRRDPARASAAV
ncbi:helix-turn-helix domain-containing protein [Bradyrhizobium symbiodeficiens]|uniref:helix-turn-helix transcriptional regulator n=1 Tax=Bradyrhizobium symbiodeficiens TaxID=1404367 RepID=UPI0030CBBF53